MIPSRSTARRFGPAFKFRRIIVRVRRRYQNIRAKPTIKIVYAGQKPLSIVKAGKIFRMGDLRGFISGRILRVWGLNSEQIAGKPIEIESQDQRFSWAKLSRVIFPSVQRSAK